MKRRTSSRESNEFEGSIRLEFWLLFYGGGRRGGVRWNVRSAFVECVLSRSSNASGMKKKRHTYRVSRPDKCRAVTFRMWRETSDNDKYTSYVFVRTRTHTVYVYLSSTSCFREENNTDIVYSRIQFLEQFPTIYTRLTKSGTFKSGIIKWTWIVVSQEVRNNLGIYLYSLITNIIGGKGGEKNVENKSVIIIASLITQWNRCVNR